MDAEAAVAADRAAVEKARADAEAAAKNTADALSAREASLDQREAAVKDLEAEARANEFEGDGIYRVGTDIKPGIYKSDGTSSCYYARLRSLTAEGIEGIITNDNVTGPVVIHVRPTDVGLKADSCGTFRKVG